MTLVCKLQTAITHGKNHGVHYVVAMIFTVRFYCVFLSEFNTCIYTY